MAGRAHAQHPGPTELAIHLLTRSEMGAMLEHLFYRAKGDTRSDLAERMPDAYQRLTSISDATLGHLTLSRLGTIRDETLASVKSKDYDPPNEHIRAHVKRTLGANGG